MTPAPVTSTPTNAPTYQVGSVFHFFVFFVLFLICYFFKNTKKILKKKHIKTKQNKHGLIGLNESITNQGYILSHQRVIGQ